MQKLLRASLLLTVSLGVAASGAYAQDADLMAKWSAVSVVRYAVTGEFRGDPIIVRGTQSKQRTGPVTDRVEITFNWNQNETALVGQPVFRNFPATFSLTPVADCPDTRVTGAYDQWEILSVTQLASTLQISGKQISPAASVPYAGEGKCGDGWDNVAAASKTSDKMLIVPPTLYFGMPMAMGAGMSISKDKKSIILVERDGWTWTYTPTPVK